MDRNKTVFKKKQIIIKCSYILCFLFLLPSCIFGENNFFTTLNPSVGDNTSSADSEFFYVDLDVNSYDASGEESPPYDINTTEFFGDAEGRDSPSNCEFEYIPQEEGEDRASEETKVCILDAPEGSFTLKDLHLVFNIPEGMCESVTWALPWHFNFPIQPGPVSIQCPVLIGSGEEATESELFCDAYNPDLEAAIRKECPANASERTCYESEEDLCPSFIGGPKCCSGGEKDDGTSWKPDEGCFDGPAFRSSSAPPEEFFVVHNVPIPEGGLRQTLSFTRLLGISSSPQNTFHANYLQTLDRSADDLKSLTLNQLPLLVRPVDYYPHAPRLFFEFACLDEGRESTHQILLMFREWNTMEEFEKFYYDSSDTSNDWNPDVEGLEGDSCKYDERIGTTGTNQCNDWRDLDDYGNNYPRQIIESGGSSPGS